jgi:hypothetical protein
MSNIYLRNITNNFQSVRLISLASWQQASQFAPRDRGGPYMVTQEGYDPEDTKVIADEFVLGRAGKWLSLSHFFRMSVAERRAEFIFGTAAEVMSLMRDLPSKVDVIRPGARVDSTAAPEQDDMAVAYQTAKSQSTNPSN